MKSKKQHASEIDARERIGRATEFSVYQYRYRERYVRDGFKTMIEAIEHARAVIAEHPIRPCLIYAGTDGVWLPVPDDMLSAAVSAQSRGE